MKKSTFDFEPRLLEHEGQVVRINFCVEKVTETFPSMGDGEDIQREVFKAFVLRMPQPLTVDAIKAALIEQEFNEYKAEALAAEIVFTGVQSGELTDNALELAKRMVIARIEEYDKSDNVNLFTYDGNPMWLGEALRRSLRERVEREVKKGNDVLPLDYNGMEISVPVQQAGPMIEALADYADECYTHTARHKAAVSALESVDAVLAYDFTTGYPEKLSFNV